MNDIERYEILVDEYNRVLSLQADAQKTENKNDFWRYQIVGEYLTFRMGSIMNKDKLN
ncbi:uncharacterized protein METZ01_LOCUS138661 [marine metagenome]|uniref:Uncharacterized protein n=1 Tax=marine metagenome TaxID=408172 RepID=A0A381ZAK0_9ZZZZ